MNMIIINEEQRKVISDILFGEYLPPYVHKQIAGAGLRQVLIKGDDHDNRLEYNTNTIKADVLSILEGNYYDNFKKQQSKELIDQAVHNTIQWVLDSYDQSDYNETLDYVLSEKIEELIEASAEKEKSL